MIMIMRCHYYSRLQASYRLESYCLARRQDTTTDTDRDRYIEETDLLETSLDRMDCMMGPIISGMATETRWTTKKCERIVN